VLAAHGTGGLATCALRPHLIIGPRDPHLVPRLLARARAGKLAIVGDGRNEVTLCAVENAVHAHLLAAQTLALGAPHGGKAYFIGQNEPVLLWAWIGELLERVGLPPLRRRVPRALAHAAGATCEMAWKLARRAGEPPMTRFVALQLASSHSYDMGPARRDFGYGEVRTLEQATDAIVEHEVRARGKA
jgi:nucleoside-diphosphate-sugar epimerase